MYPKVTFASHQLLILTSAIQAAQVTVGTTSCAIDLETCRVLEVQTDIALAYRASLKCLDFLISHVQIIGLACGICRVQDGTQLSNQLIGQHFSDLHFFGLLVNKQRCLTLSLRQNSGKALIQ